MIWPHQNSKKVWPNLFSPKTASKTPHVPVFAQNHDNSHCQFTSSGPHARKGKWLRAIAQSESNRACIVVCRRPKGKKKGLVNKKDLGVHTNRARGVFTITRNHFKDNLKNAIIGICPEGIFLHDKDNVNNKKYCKKVAHKDVLCLEAHCVVL